MESIRVLSRLAGIGIVLVFAAGIAQADVRDERGNVIYEGVFPGGIPQVTLGEDGKIVQVTVLLDNGKTAVITDGYHRDLEQWGAVLLYAARHRMGVVLHIDPIGNLVKVTLRPRQPRRPRPWPADPQPAIPVQ